MSELPLLPLPEVVVFPGMTLPLHLSEERYRRLLRLSLEQERQRFVIALSPEPNPGDCRQILPRFGSYVEVISVSENTDGSYDLVVHGQDRCRLRVTREEMVPEGSGTERSLLFVEDEPAPLGRGDPNQEQVAAWDALEAFQQYASAFFAQPAREQIEQALPDDLMYQASFICANLHLPPPSRQLLLEAETLTDRFQLARHLITERLSGLSPQGAPADE